MAPETMVVNSEIESPEHSVSDVHIDATPDAPSRKRQRIESGVRKGACQSCRLRKVKCNRQRPSCDVCDSSGAKCQYDREGEVLTLQLATSRILDRIGKLQNGLDALTKESRRTTEHTHPSPLAHHPRTVSQSSDDAIANFTALEPSRDFLQIPPHRTSSDSVLCWEVFDGKYGPNELVKPLFTESPSSSADEAEEVFTTRRNFRPIQEERIPALIDNFLQNVHTKNPVLNVEQLVREGRKAAHQGLGWDAWSCLVLLACALGSVAKPFAFAESLAPIIQKNSFMLETPSKDQRRKSESFFSTELEHGDSYFLLASRRLGTLKHTILGAQAHFFAGVYLMYTLRPLLSWQYFFHASILFQLHLKTTHGIHATIPGAFEIPAAHLDMMDRKRRRLEQSLYWSCFKSECEFRVELPLPQSEIGTYEHPNLFPSPPSPATPVPPPDSLLQRSPGSISFSRSDSLHTQSSSSSKQLTEEQQLKQHAKRLCREEESWYYYLTEIALRRIGNRIINTFFRQDRTAWLNVRPLLRIAQEFDVQVSSWSANLPSVMKHYEDISTIKAPMFNAQPEDPGSFVSRELSWATENRILEMRSWLYQPFLYYFIHSPSVRDGQGRLSHRYHARANIDSLLNPTSEMHPSSPTDSMRTAPIPPEALSEEEQSTLHHMITSGIECNLRILDVRSLQHRHHGLWYDLRSLVCACLILLGIVKTGHQDLIPGGVELLWGGGATASQLLHNGNSGSSVGGKIGHVLTQLEFWSGESPELSTHHRVLLQVTQQVQEQLAGRA